MISTHRLGRSSGQTHALRDVDLEIAAGECVAVTSAPGDGRSILVRVLATLLAPTSGTLTIAGVDAVGDVYQARRHLAYVGTRLAGDCRLPTRDYLLGIRAARLGADGAGRRAVDDCLARAVLAPDAMVDTLPVDTKARLALATAMLVQPRVLLLEDPLGAITPGWHRAGIDWLREVRDAGTTLVMAMAGGDDLLALCHRVEHVVAGRLAAPACNGVTPVHAPAVTGPAT